MADEKSLTARGTQVREHAPRGQACPDGVCRVYCAAVASSARARGGGRTLLGQRDVVRRWCEGAGSVRDRSTSTSGSVLTLSVGQDVLHPYTLRNLPL